MELTPEWVESRGTIAGGNSGATRQMASKIDRRHDTFGTKLVPFRE
jgi:hypothetical protein